MQCRARPNIGLGDAARVFFFFLARHGAEMLSISLGDDVRLETWFEVHGWRVVVTWPCGTWRWPLRVAGGGVDPSCHCPHSNMSSNQGGGAMKKEHWTLKAPTRSTRAEDTLYIRDAARTLSPTDSQNAATGSHSHGTSSASSFLQIK